MAFPPDINGLSWFGVDSIASFPSFRMTQAQPDPNRPTPAAANFVLKSAKEPNADLIASASAPVGSPPPPFFMIFQNIEWFQWPPPLFRTAVRIFSGTRSRLESKRSIDRAERSACPSRALLRLVT